MNSDASTTSAVVANKRTLVGRVTSNKMTRTVTVLVERKVQHPLYGKYLVRSNKYHADTGTEQYAEGDTVEIQESRPLSRTKNWVVTKLVQKGVAL
jgi:small subunit ribosomal protein S17